MGVVIVMSNNILLAVFLLFIASYFVYIFISEFKIILKIVAEIRGDRVKMASWPKLKGRVMKVGYGIDYEYPQLRFEYEKKRNPEYVSPYPKDVLDVALSSRENIEYYGDVYIEYKYVSNNDVWVSRRISLIKSDSNLKFMYKVKPGDVVNVIVNPDDISDCYLRIVTEKEIDEYCNSLIVGSIKMIVFSAISFAGSMVALFGEQKI
jgi:hypothetical protein